MKSRVKGKSMSEREKNAINMSVRWLEKQKRILFVHV